LPGNDRSEWNVLLYKRSAYSGCCDFNVGGRYAAAGQNFSLAQIDQRNTAGIVDFPPYQTGPAGPAKPRTAVTMHFHPLLFQTVENVVIIGFLEITGYQLIVNVDSMAHSGFLKRLKFKFGKVAAVYGGIDLTDQIG
jgi:hypothetical protein